MAEAIDTVTIMGTARLAFGPLFTLGCMLGHYGMREDHCKQASLERFRSASSRQFAASAALLIVLLHVVAQANAAAVLNIICRRSVAGTVGDRLRKSDLAARLVKRSG